LFASDECKPPTVIDAALPLAEWENSMLNVDLMLEGSAFFSNLDDKPKAKFKA